MTKIIITTLTSLLISNAVLASSVQQTLPHNSVPLNVSFVQTAPESQFAIIDKKNGLYKLTLQDVSPRTTYFSDRPNRVVGQFINTEFLAKWNQGKDNFKQNPPNAVLSAAIHNQADQDQFVNVVVELSNPVYSNAKHSLTYDAKLLDNNNHPITNVPLHHAILFIDEACLSCVG